MVTDWESLFSQESAKPYWARLQRFLEDERSRGEVYPPTGEVYTALDLTLCSEVKVVILGQDPYPRQGQAHGLAFSVKAGVAPPVSLRNIFKELESDLGIPRAGRGCLERWARQGVLLLNTTLTVRAGTAASHRRQGWESFTDAVIDAVNDKPEPVVFLLWGRAAQSKRARIDTPRHGIIESAHPAARPNARLPFAGSKPFSHANEFLRKHGQEPVDWQIADL